MKQFKIFAGNRRGKLTKRANKWLRKNDIDLIDWVFVVKEKGGFVLMLHYAEPIKSDQIGFKKKEF